MRCSNRLGSNRSDTPERTLQMLKCLELSQHCGKSQELEQEAPCNENTPWASRDALTRALENNPRCTGPTSTQV